MSAAEVESYRRHTGTDPFDPIPGTNGFHLIRKRDDGACVFLTADNRCRIHEELGANRKPLTCRLFPFAFHSDGNGTIVPASFGCPTIVANEGPLVDAPESRAALESLRKEWFAIHPTVTTPPQLVKGRSLTPRSARVLRDHLLAMLPRDARDIRDNIARIAAALDDLTRSRVLSLADDAFAEYLSLTLPHAAAKAEAPARRRPSVVGRLLQYGFLYIVTAIRADLEHPRQSKMQLRLLRLRLLAHFHRLAPGLERVNIAALGRVRVDINDPDLRPIVVHYLRSAIETLGGGGRPVVEELALAVSHLNAALALAAMDADAAGASVTRTSFIQALMEASDISHARSPILEWAAANLAGGTEAIWKLAT